MDGTQFGRYRLVELLGRGGMGEVWRAHDTETDRIVAIKVLPAHLSADEEYQRRFRKEAHAAARLNNPHVIPIHNYGEIDGRLYVDMRLVEGRDLQAVLAEGPLQPARAVRVVDQIANAVHAAHQVGLLHRDIKPSNILVDRDDFAYLIDFGIARVVDETRMTQTGTTIGSFAYIAPERLDPHAPEDARADVYSLACVLYEALTGQPPFPGTTTVHLIAAHLSTPPPSASIAAPQVPRRVDAVIATGMAKNPNNRYATSIELAEAAREAITVPLAAPPGPSLAATRVVGNYGPAPLHRGAPAGQPGAMSGFGSNRGPRRPRRAGLMAAIVATVTVLVAGVIGIAGYFLVKHRQPAQKPTAQPTSIPVSGTPQPPPPNTLDGLLLSVDQVNTAMGATGMSSAGTMTTMGDNSFMVSDRACLPLSAAVQAPVYAGSGYSAMRAQVVGTAQQSAVDQAVVLFPSTHDASSFFTASTQSWQACANRQFTIAANGNSQVQTVGPVSDSDGILTATVTASNSVGACERALTVADNIAIDVTACPGPAGAAVSIAHQIAAKVP